jgi:hypothetical protein
VNVDNIESQTDLNDRVGVAAFSAHYKQDFQTFIIYVQYGHKQRRKTLYWELE